MPQVNGLLALISSTSINPKAVKEALKSLSHRAASGYAGLKEGKLLGLDRPRGLSSNFLALGCLAPFTSDLKEEILLHGSIYHPESFTISPQVLRGDFESLANSLGEVDGSYSFAHVEDGSVICGCDPLGSKPLFTARSEKIVGVATEPNPLYRVGLERVEQLRPGFIYKFTLNGAKSFQIPSGLQDPITSVEMSEAASKVLRLLETSVKRRIRRIGRVAIASSGGIDSALLAKLCRKHVDVTLVSLGVEDSQDLREAEKLSDMLNVESCPLQVTGREALSALTSVEELLPSHHILTVSIGLAMNLISKHSASLGLTNLILGQLADEQFGGYARYVRVLSEEGEAAVQKAMCRDTLNAYSADFLRDERVTSPYVSTSLPYAQLDLVKYSLHLPVSLKINLERNLRKWVLREAAVRAGLPDEVAYRPKKAIQYSSGLQKIVKSWLKH